MCRLHLAAAPFALALCFSFTSRGTELAFAPKAGLVLEKTCEFSLDMELTDFALSMNGQDMEIPEKPEVSNSARGHLVVTDTYTSVDGARVKKLTRTFDEATEHKEGSGPEGETNEDSTSPLEKRTVVFTYDEDEDAYTAAFGPDDAEADADLLVDLDENIDFDGFLPRDDVDTDDSWTVDAARFSDMLSIGGDLKFDDEEDGPQEELIDEAIDDNLEGEMTCTFKGMREVDGRRLAVIAIVIDAEGEAESESTEDVGESGFTLDVSRQAHAELDLEGELLWDVTGGHFASIELAGTVSITMTETGSGDFNDREFEQTMTIGFGGDLSFSFTATASQ
jgi:hypothetical protein